LAEWRTRCDNKFFTYLLYFTTKTLPGCSDLGDGLFLENGPYYPAHFGNDTFVSFEKKREIDKDNFYSSR
jgi:hypothetical protein